VAVWQAKFFVTDVGRPQQQQIRESLAQVLTKASEEGFTVEFWTLCIPILMSPAEAKWFDGWRKREQKEHADLTITEPWDRDKLSSLLYSPEGIGLRVEFLGSQEKPPLREIVEPPPGLDFDEMLFIRQLRAAGIIELRAPKREFFNAEVLGREVQEKAVPEELRELIAERVDVHSIWSVAFNGACSSARDLTELSGLYERVMRELRETHALRDPPPLGMRPVHRLGTMHQVVDDGEAGWRRDYLEIAREHGGES